MKTTVTIVYELPEDELEYEIHTRAADVMRLCEQMIEEFKANVDYEGEPEFVTVPRAFLMRMYYILLEARGD